MLIHTITIRLILEFMSVVIFKNDYNIFFLTAHRIPFYLNVIGQFNEKAQDSTYIYRMYSKYRKRYILK